MKPYFKDSLDGQFDLSDWVINAHGFVPFPSLITEPAVGGFGGLLGLAFLTPVAGAPPNITAGFGGYTANNSWILGGIQTKNITNKGLKLRYGLFYYHINISLYREVPLIGEKEFAFTFKSLPVFIEATKKIGDSDFSVGLNYRFSSVKVNPHFESIPESIQPEDFKGNISKLSPVLIYDTRDNVFSPNKGTMSRVMFSVSNEFIFSDFNYTELEAGLYKYLPINPKWVMGIRAEYQQVFNDPPFYELPSVNLRGVPAARYQNNQITTTEMENRFDLNQRWSIMAFGGLAKAFDGFQEFGDEKLVYNVGTGFRYLLARKFGLRMGVDVAKGPDSWGYYIVFGSNWLR
ncbi:BamA/TamA family outer membrane protein [Echinicola sp. CAU 1574]|uniref:BamA/TamA family outer membrane protein n=1 Tax=Echinicola arenosa TaxID=2774144 RepID=A0ABR9AFY1_9BACT|nr:BamA/TamA family outer membrane protein [Echinicola arenosa]MBD8487770.1 BamA/TamA family outer membrane protein [Echinicola arenosa]